MAVEPTDKEVVNVMIDGGKKLCDHAMEQWHGGKYGEDETMKQSMIAHWKAVKGRISDLGRRFKQEVTEQCN